MITCSMPLAMASSTPYWIVGLSTRGSISFGWALVTGKNRVPRPAAGKIALRTVERAVRAIKDNLYVGHAGRHPAGDRGPHGARRRGQPAHAPRRREWHVRDTRDDRAHGMDEPSLSRTPAAAKPHHR